MSTVQLHDAAKGLTHHNFPMNSARLFKRIHELRDATGYSSDRAVCVAAGVAPDFLRDVRVGRNKQPAVEKIAAVAGVLGVSVDELLTAAGIDKVIAGPGVGMRPPEMTSATVIGEVEAGAWREALEWAKEMQYAVPVIKDVRFGDARYFALRLGGDSMTRLYPIPRTVVICVPFLDLGRGPLDGEVVIAQRQRHDLFEATCKVFVLRGDQAWLEPRSNNPAHQPLRLVRTKAELAAARKANQPAAMLDEGEAGVPRDTDLIKITARVSGAYAEQ